jgi:hypothetical protein
VVFFQLSVRGILSFFLGEQPRELNHIVLVRLEAEICLYGAFSFHYGDDSDVDADVDEGDGAKRIFERKLCLSSVI